MFLIVLIVISERLDEKIVKESTLDVFGFLIHLRQVLLGNLGWEDRVQGFLLEYTNVRRRAYNNCSTNYRPTLKRIAIPSLRN